jgi:hypothetical protein
MAADDVAPPAALRAAISDLGQTFPQYDAAGYLKRLADWEQRHAAAGTNTSALASEFAALKRQALLANPLFLKQPWLFVTRWQYAPDHHNTETMFLTGECNTQSYHGTGALKILDPATLTVRTLLDAGSNGVARDPDVHFSGTRILFSMRRNIEDDYHLYEIETNGTGLKQLTRLPHAADFDPIYLPDGGIVFSSTREPKYCGCNQHIMANLYRMEADGANIHRIGGSTLFEGHNRLMPDGRILYVRWEYVDRNFGDAQGLWTVNPDGTGHAIYWGNNKPSPGAVLDPRPVPGTDWVVCTFSSCHDRPWGALALMDRRRGIDAYADDKESVLMTWPRQARDIVGHDGIDAFTRVRPRHEDPYPLSDKYYLCSREIADADYSGPTPKPEMGLYLVDTFGNNVLIHAEGPGCYNPVPLAPRTTPPIIPVRREFDHSPAVVYILDALQGTHMQGVHREDIKYLRIVESPEKRHWTGPAWGGQGVQRPAMNWHNFENKRILGTVPVEDDGSVYMEVPSDTYVFFQLLDKDHRMIHSMRSGVVFQAGERASCVGCHENRLATPVAALTQKPKALTRKPSRLEGWYGAPRLFSFMTEVQPVLDKHCVQCHDFGKRAGEKLNLAADRDLYFNAAYESLYQHWNQPNGFLRTIGAGPAEIQQANTWGSRVSPLMNKLIQGHKRVALSEEELDRIATWIDLNAPYYPSYACAYPDNLTGRSPLTGAELGKLKDLTGVDFGAFNSHDRLRGALVSFDRPELSPCLTNKLSPDSPQYKEALALIQTGKQRLAEHPRGDTIDFTPCQKDQERESLYQERQALEWKNRQAIQENRKVYDPQPGNASTEGKARQSSSS